MLLLVNDSLLSPGPFYFWPGLYWDSFVLELEVWANILSVMTLVGWGSFDAQCIEVLSKWAKLAVPFIRRVPKLLVALFDCDRTVVVFMIVFLCWRPCIFYLLFHRSLVHFWTHCHVHRAVSINSAVDIELRVRVYDVVFEERLVLHLIIQVRNGALAINFFAIVYRSCCKSACAKWIVIGLYFHGWRHADTFG